MVQLQGVNSGLGAVGIVDIEALAGLAAQVAAANHLADQRASAILAVAGFLVQNVHDGQADVQADEVAQLQGAQFELAEMKARVDAAKYLVYKAGLKKQQAMNGAKVRYSVEAAEAKLIASRTASDVTRRCLQLFGGYGYTRDYPIERMMRDAKITEIYEGTSEVQMMVISGALLK